MVADPLVDLRASEAESERRLLAHWRFDETSGAVALDETGSFPGQLSPTGVTRTSKGVVGGALEFSRAGGGFVDVGPVLSLVGQSFSISAWIRIPVGESSPVAGILTKHRPGTGNGYGLLFNEFNVPGAGDRVAFFVGDYGFVGDFDVPYSTDRVNDNLWHHVVVTYRPGGQNRLFLDGSPSESSRAVRPQLESVARVIIGGIDTGSPQGTFTGSIDEVRIFGFELADEDVDQLFRSPGTVLPTRIDPLTITPAGGAFLGPVWVILRSSLLGAELRYTVDGTEPTPSSTRYQSPFTVNPPATLRARAFVNGFPVSSVSEAEYIRTYADAGIPDAWRERHFGPGFSTDPRVAASADPDGDGTSNIEEYEAGTLPLDPLSGFRARIRVLPEIRFTSVSGKSYRILRKGSLTGEVAKVVATITATGPNTVFVDSEADAREALYLIELVP